MSTRRPLPPPHRNRDVRVPKEAVPDFVVEEATGRLEGEQLRFARSRRPTPERISKVETRQDKLESSLAETREQVARMDGKLDTLVTLASKADAERERRVAAEAVALEKRRKHTIAIISALGVAIAGIVAAGVV